MALTTTGNHPKALWPGVYGWFGAEYANHDTEYTELFDIKTSSQKYEEIVEDSSYGLAPVKPEGGSVFYDTNTQGATSRFTNVAYGLGYIVTREELADNLYMQVSKQRATSLAFSMNQSRENVGAQVYNRAFNGTYNGADGTTLISTAHPALLGGNQSNQLSTNADFSEAALEDLTISIMDARNSKNLRISLKPTVLIGPNNLVYEFERVLKSTLRVSTADNDTNALRATGAVPRAITNHYLTDTDAWFLRTTAPSSLCWFDRERVEFTKDKDFDTDNAKAKAYMRFVAGWSDWRGIYGTEGA